MNIYVILYVILAVLFAAWGVIRQKQRWCGNSYLRLIMVFILNSVGFPICLIITIYNKNFFPDGTPPEPIDSVQKKLKNDSK